VKAQHPDVTILLAHSGAICDSAGCTGEILDVARALGPGSVDLIVAGHTHRRIVRTVAGIPIVEPGSSGTSLGIADVVRTATGIAVRPSLRDVYDDAVTPDSALAAKVAAWRETSDARARQTVAALADSLPRAEDENHEYPLGDLIADAQRAAAGADVAVMNNGGIRASLPAGPVSYGQLFEVQPFGNGVVRMTVTGAELRRVLEHAIEADGPHAHISGISVRYDATRPAGERVLEVRRADGRPVRDDDRLTLAVNDFMAGGGSGFASLTTLKAEPVGVTDLEALIAYLRERPQPVVAPPADRFSRARS
jgi:5'-nucleotidase